MNSFFKIVIASGVLMASPTVWAQGGFLNFEDHVVQVVAGGLNQAMAVHVVPKPGAGKSRSDNTVMCKVEGELSLTPLAAHRVLPKVSFELMLSSDPSQSDKVVEIVADMEFQPPTREGTLTEFLLAEVNMIGVDRDCAKLLEGAIMFETTVFDKLTGDTHSRYPAGTSYVANQN
jgi:hypothetical protein